MPHPPQICPHQSVRGQCYILSGWGGGKDLLCYEKCDPALKDVSTESSSKPFVAGQGAAGPFGVRHTQPLLELWELAVMV